MSQDLPIRRQGDQVEIGIFGKELAKSPEGLIYSPVERAIHGWNVYVVKRRVERPIPLAVSGDFGSVVGGNFFPFTVGYECHCAVYMLVINRKVFGTPAMKPKNAKDHPSLWKMQ